MVDSSLPNDVVFGESSAFNVLNDGHYNNQADCRLLGLAAELRNKIYSELLRFEDVEGPKHCSPAILATCRQAYTEGHSILYGVNDFAVIMDLNPARPYNSLFGFGHPWKIFSLGRELPQLRFDLDPAGCDWPQPLLMATQIRLAIVLRSPVIHGQMPMASGQDLGLSPELRELNRVIYQLYGFLQASSVVKEVRIEVQVEDASLSEGSLTELISPARLIAPSIDVSIHGVSSALASNIRAATTPAYRRSPTGDLFKKYHQLKREVSSRCMLANALRVTSPHESAIATRTELLVKLFAKPIIVERQEQLEKVVGLLEAKLDEAGTSVFTQAIETANARYKDMIGLETARIARKSGGNAADREVSEERH
ncbi:hypothetical protein LTR36_003604 [Oleoguttula mirabilis]|uniref:Uncharacterized protein n=1 Tax=Oleoguttula mirabilis TaxID=1507867 RepID=A0AAV9JJ89_9PEZI|nr:hypothetical protein LTR36_003604 [Oleoguttula mirabilis]